MGKLHCLPHILAKINVIPNREVLKNFCKPVDFFQAGKHYFLLQKKIVLKLQQMKKIHVFISC